MPDRRQECDSSRVIRETFVDMFRKRRGNRTDKKSHAVENSDAEVLATNEREKHMVESDDVYDSYCISMTSDKIDHFVILSKVKLQNISLLEPPASDKDNSKPTILDRELILEIRPFVGEPPRPIRDSHDNPVKLQTATLKLDSSNTIKSAGNTICNIVTWPEDYRSIVALDLKAIAAKIGEEGLDDKGGAIIELALIERTVAKTPRKTRGIPFLRRPPLAQKTSSYAELGIFRKELGGNLTRTTIEIIENEKLKDIEGERGSIGKCIVRRNFGKKCFICLFIFQFMTFSRICGRGIKCDRDGNEYHPRFLANPPQERTGI